MLTVCTTSPEDKWANLGDFLTVISATASSSGMEKALVDDAHANCQPAS